MDQSFEWVLSVITGTWNFLQQYTYHGVTLGMYFVGLFILGILIERIFG